ncbi:hypothetical protein GN244_ATG09549 [Phytophthora infestans]|uniref:Uncharacterized protein n=1 Tax=Phytophthora infestans TaxID=4787 RepID=A0A833ST76_PHYIN|nr:hypothetical protein GN244_ATG09549 [Phytophthora infestans]
MYVLKVTTMLPPDGSEDADSIVVKGHLHNRHRCSSANAHGQMLVPDYRQISAKFRKDSGALSQAGDQELQYAPVENLQAAPRKISRRLRPSTS